MSFFPAIIYRYEIASLLLRVQLVCAKVQIKNEIMHIFVKNPISYKEYCSFKLKDVDFANY